MKTKATIIFAACVWISCMGQAQTPGTTTLDLEKAARIAHAAHERAMQDEWNVAIVILDAGGHMLYFKRMDGTQLASIDVAIEKAKTALFYKRPTKIFQDRLAQGEAAILSLPDMMPFEGGLPVTIDGVVVGSIGVSGVTAQQDGIIAAAGLNAL